MLTFNSRRFAALFLILLPTLTASAGDLVIQYCGLEVANSDVFATIIASNDHHDELATSATVKVLDPEDQEMAVVSVSVKIKPGENQITIPFSALYQLTEEDRSTLPFQRLNCSLSNPGGGVSQTVRGVAEVSPQAFALRLVTPARSIAEATIPIFLGVSQVFNGEPVPHHPVRLSFEIEEQAVGKPLDLFTGPDGTLQTEVKLPLDVADLNLLVVASISSGPFCDKQRSGVDTEDPWPISVATDRTVYKPGQTMHFRILALRRSQQALADRPFIVTLIDPDDTIVKEWQLTTSEHGVAHGDWQIPGTAMCGDYEMQIKASNKSDTRRPKHLSFRITDYEMPRFTATLKSSSDFYLPGETAIVTAEVTTLAKHPLLGMHVSLLEAEFSRWGKDDSSDSEEILGFCRTRGDGRCDIHVDLADDYEKFSSSRIRYVDSELMARITDPDTGSEIYRRVVLRATGEPIHVYAESRFWNTAGLPARLMVSTSSAAGEPKPCSVSIHEDDDGKPGRLLATSMTDQYGLAEVLVEGRDEVYSEDLLLVATDGDGATGNGKCRLWFSQSEVVRIRSDRVFHKIGDSIEILINSSMQQAPVTVEAWIGDVYLRMWSLMLEAGKARLTIPFDPRFQGEVRLEAYFSQPRYEQTELNGGTATVLFPLDRSIELGLSFDPPLARPGETVKAEFSLSDRLGRDLDGVLGVTVLDTAVEAMLEDRGVSEYLATFCRQSEEFLMAWPESYAGYTRQRLADFDPEQPPEDLDLLAQTLLGWDDSQRWLIRTENSATLRSLYSDRFRRRFSDLFALRLQPPGQPRPTTTAQLIDLVQRSGSSIDPWGQQFRCELEITGNQHRALVVSAGPDRTFDTPDDLNALWRQWPWLLAVGRQLKPALRVWHDREERWPQTLEQVLTALNHHGIDCSSLSDPWGQALRIAVKLAGHQVRIRVLSAGPDGRWSDGNPEDEDITAWKIDLNTFTDSEWWIRDAISIIIAAGDEIPDSEAKLRAILKNSSMPAEQLLDLHGNPYSLIVRRQPVWYTRYRANAASFEAEPTVAEELMVRVSSFGPDGQPGTTDDVFVARFASPLPGGSEEAEPPQPEIELGDGNFGAIAGLVNGNELPLPGVKVTAETADGHILPATIVGSDGRFMLLAAPGSYTVKFEMPGFPTVTREVLVREWRISVVDVELQSSGFVQVVAEVPHINSTSCFSGEAVQADGLLGRQADQPKPRMGTDCRPR